jgi:hypothetical protein
MKIQITKPVFIPENFKGGPVAPLTLEQGVVSRNRSGGHFDPKKFNSEFFQSFSNMFDKDH